MVPCSKPSTVFQCVFDILAIIKKCQKDESVGGRLAFDLQIRDVYLHLQYLQIGIFPKQCSITPESLYQLIFF